MATAALVGLAVPVPASPAQLPPLLPEPTTTTTEPPPATDPPPPPEGSPGGGGPAPVEPTPDGAAPGSEGSAPDSDGGDPPPEGGPGPDGGDPPPAGGRTVPPEAQAIIDSVPRTGSSSSAALVAALDELTELGVPRDEALRVGMGRFPIAGAATYSHDWLFPRYGPGFRFHLGTDVFAPHGTPIRAPVDGVATTRTDSLGGLTVRVTMDDGTFFYLAHLSGLVEGFTDGMAVTTGEVVGFVGDSGNARGGAPHLHIGVYPQGGPPVDPKPLLDGFLDEARARLPEVVEAYRAAGYGAARPAGPAGPAGTDDVVDDPPPVPGLGAGAPPAPAPRPAAEARPAGVLPTGVLYAAGSNPVGGALAVVGSEVVDLAASIDWAARSRPAAATTLRTVTAPR